MATLPTALVANPPIGTRRTSVAFPVDADPISAEEPYMRGLVESVATASSGPSAGNEEVHARAGRPRRDPTLSERKLTRLRV